MMGGSRRALLISGALLFLVGLLAGALVPYMHNPRMGLSAHLAGVQNALFLLVVAALWDHVSLPRRLSGALAWLGIGSMYGFWAALQLAAIWGTSQATPIAGAGFEGAPWQEGFVTWLLRGSSVAAVASTALLLTGFIKAKGAPAVER